MTSPDKEYIDADRSSKQNDNGTFVKTDKNTTIKDEKKNCQVWFILLLPVMFAVVLYSGWWGHEDTVKQEERESLSVHQVNHHELRLMLVGKTGAGKSASGNTILGEEAFRVESSPASVTGNCKKINKLVDARNITIIDTPGVMDTWLTSDQTAHHAPDCITAFSYDPHVIVLVIKLERFIEEDRNPVKWIQDNFGEEALKFTMILFTGGDLVEGKSVEKFISNNVELQGLIDTCEGRYHVFNNNNQTNHSQVTEFFKKIDTIIYENMGYTYIKEVIQRTRKEEEIKRRIWEEKIKKEEKEKREKMEHLIREEENVKRKQQEIKAKDEAVNECNNIRLEIRREEEQKRKQIEENMKAEQQRKLNDMAMKLRDEQYENKKLTEELEKLRKQCWF